jgi:hypothetical protein
MITSFSAFQLFQPPSCLCHHGLQDVGILHINDSNFTNYLELQLLWALACACHPHCRLQDMCTLRTNDFDSRILMNINFSELLHLRTINVTSSNMWALCVLLTLVPCITPSSIWVERIDALMQETDDSDFTSFPALQLFRPLACPCHHDLTLCWYNACIKWRALKMGDKMSISLF